MSTFTGFIDHLAYIAVLPADVTAHGLLVKKYSQYLSNQLTLKYFRSVIRVCLIEKSVYRSELKGSRATLESTGKADSDDGGSLNEYAGDVDFGKFNEEGSFVGEYATNTNQ